MKIIAMLLLAAASMTASAGNSATYKVTITNLTKGQPLTPPVVIAASYDYQLFQLGEAASDGLRYLAEDGATDMLVTEITGNEKVKAHAIGAGLILPGQSQTIEINANPHARLSLVSMLAKTNDAFISKKALPLRVKPGHKYAVLAKVFDAGTEINNESADYIPALGSPNVRTEENEGFVHLHPGVQGIGDLNLLTDAFAGIAAKIVIERVR